MVVNVIIWISVLFFGITPESAGGAVYPDVIRVSESNMESAVRMSEAALSPAEAGVQLMEEVGLNGIIDQEAFVAAYMSVVKHDRLDHRILAIADMSLPSTEKRLYLIDMTDKRFILNTWVAHGQNTGELYAKHFSNKEGSHQSSKGLYRVGHRIISPKHGPALLLHGLDEGVNDQAEAREIIMHKAPYVSKDFIEENGHLGRSWGCPAVSEEAMPLMLKHLANNGLLFIHA
jgi:hypothetical protein